jgi:hypothetical protein
LEAVSFCIVFECHSFFGSDLEVINGHGIEKKEINSNSGSENYAVERKISNTSVK